MIAYPWTQIVVDTRAEQGAVGLKLPFEAMCRIFQNGRSVSAYTEERAQTMMWPIGEQRYCFSKHTNPNHPITDGVFYDNKSPNIVLWKACIRSMTNSGISFEQSSATGSKRIHLSKSQLLEFVGGSDWWIVCDIRNAAKHTYHLINSSILLDQVEKDLICIQKKNKWKYYEFDEFFKYMKQTIEIRYYQWDIIAQKLKKKDLT